MLKVHVAPDGTLDAIWCYGDEPLCRTVEGVCPVGQSSLKQVWTEQKAAKMIFFGRRRMRRRGISADGTEYRRTLGFR